MALPIGTTLWRVHNRSYKAHEFRPVSADPTKNTSKYFGDGGRFDSTADDPYPFLYAGYTPTAALAETFLRQLPFTDTGWRRIPRPKLDGKRLSMVATTQDVKLIRLISSLDLAAVCQDEWLVDVELPHYPQTRHWAHWLRRTFKDAQGLVWQSKRDRPNLSVIIFGDRCPDGIDAPMPARFSSIDLDSIDGAEFLNEVLAPYRVTVRKP
jgi:hypothetical protein